MVNGKEVKSAAENARINVEDEEAESFAEEFENILEMFETLEEIDTSDVEPAFHPIETEAKSRKDEKEEPLGKEQVFQNTDNEENGFFKGPNS